MVLKVQFQPASYELILTSLIMKIRLQKYPITILLTAGCLYLTEIKPWSCYQNVIWDLKLWQQGKFKLHYQIKSFDDDIVMHHNMMQEACPGHEKHNNTQISRKIWKRTYMSITTKYTMFIEISDVIYITKYILGKCFKCVGKMREFEFLIKYLF